MMTAQEALRAMNLTLTIRLDPHEMPGAIDDAIKQLEAIRDAWDDSVSAEVDQAVAIAERRFKGGKEDDDGR